MKDVLSRKVHDRKKSYRRVVEQQGRTKLDSEFPEEHDIAPSREARVELALGSRVRSPNPTFELPKILEDKTAQVEIYINEAGHIENEEILELVGRKEILEIGYSAGVVEEVWVRWNPLKRFDSASRHDRVYTTVERDGSTYVGFGDGVRGARPPSGTDNIKAVYRIGVGADGKLKKGVLATLISTTRRVKIKYCKLNTN